MIEYVNANFETDGRLHVRMSDTSRFVVAVWERIGSLWHNVACYSPVVTESPLSAEEIGRYSRASAQIVKAMTEVPA